MKYEKDNDLDQEGDQRHGRSTLNIKTRTGDQDVWRRARRNIDAEHTRTSEATTDEIGIEPT